MKTPISGLNTKTAHIRTEHLNIKHWGKPDAAAGVTKLQGFSRSLNWFMYFYFQLVFNRTVTLKEDKDKN